MIEVTNRPLFGNFGVGVLPPVIDRTTSYAADHSYGVVANGISVSLRWDVDRWLALDEATAMFGEGSTVSLAHRDLLGALTALRDDLAEDESVLTDRLAAQLRYLRSLNL